MTLATRLRRPATIRSILVTAGVFGWLALAALGFRMYGTGPQPGAGFDLWLLTEGGLHVAAGITPYDPTMLAGGSVRIANLFYSYPPLVAQAFSLLAFAPAFAIFAGAARWTGNSSKRSVSKTNCGSNCAYSLEGHARR